MPAIAAERMKQICTGMGAQVYVMNIFRLKANSLKLMPG
jgi:hypothetical protein